MNRQILIAALLLGTLLIGSGCISKVEDWDKFSSYLSNPVVYNFSRYLNASANEPLNKTHPCTCMVCSDEQAAWTKWVPDFLLKDKYTNFSLITSTCNFVRCNQTGFTDIVSSYITRGAKACEITDPVTGKVDDRLCGPRYFMLGQGPDAAEYARAQGFCDGQLKMPVIWAIPNETGELTRNLSAPTLSCYLQKDQMPMVVWYSKGQSIASALGQSTPTIGYTKMLRTLNQSKTIPPVNGPIMVSTEALLDPRLPMDPNSISNNPPAPGTTSPAPVRLLNFSALDAVRAQILAIKKECPKCLSVLAVKPVFWANSTQVPDLCALDYLLNTAVDRARPDGCRAEYGSDMARYNDRRNADLWTKVDLIGVGFIANEDDNLSVCSPETEVGRQLMYSREALRRFYKPSVWYAIGMAEGPTADPRCEFSEVQVGNAWQTLIGYGPALAGTGVIGIAPYRFSDDPANAPLNLTVERPYFDSSLGSLDDIRNPPVISPSNPSGQRLTITSIDANQPLEVVVDKYVPAMSGADRAVFSAGDGRVYAARMNPKGGVSIYRMASKYGFMNLDFSWHNTSAYNWFSNCEFYSRNRAPMWSSAMPLDGVMAGITITPTDAEYDSLLVTSINSTSKEEVLFYANDSRPYAAREDGAGLKIFDRPLVEQATVQPIMFPTNGRAGAQCMAFETTKMYPRMDLRYSSDAGTYNLTPTRNAEDKKTIASLSCGGTGCLASVPMPKAFCYRKNSFVSFKKDYCSVYPQIDDAVSNQGFDSMFMRAIFQQESGGAFNRCAMSKNESSAANCGGSKNCYDLQKAATSTMGLDDPLATNTCDPQKVWDRCYSIQQASFNPGVVCAMGISQCIDKPFSTSGAAGFCGVSAPYNPFDPANSACCGTYKIVNALYGGQTRPGGILAQIRAKMADADWRRYIQPGEEEWYAAWLSLRNYRGGDSPTIDDLDYAFKHVSKSELDAVGGPIAWIDLNLESAGVRYYHTDTILRYNDALKKCDAGCLYRDCDAVVAGGGDGGGDTGEVIVP